MVLIRSQEFVIELYLWTAAVVLLPGVNPPNANSSPLTATQVEQYTGTSVILFHTESDDVSLHDCRSFVSEQVSTDFVLLP